MALVLRFRIVLIVLVFLALFYSVSTAGAIVSGVVSLSSNFNKEYIFEGETVELVVELRKAGLGDVEDLFYLIDFSDNFELLEGDKFTDEIGRMTKEKYILKYTLRAIYTDPEDPTATVETRISYKYGTPLGGIKEKTGYDKTTIFVLPDRNREVNRLKTTLNEKNKTIVSLNNRVESLNKTIASLNTQIAIKDREISDLKKGKGILGLPFWSFALLLGIVLGLSIARFLSKKT